jgi:predicted glutamine amidotransferase
MCRLLGHCSLRSAPVASLLTEEGLRGFTALSAFHGDGWGMAWYNTDGPHVQKSTRRAQDEPDYSRLTHRALGRSSPGDARAWPFTWGFWVVGAGF